MGYCSRIYVVKKYNDWYRPIFIFNMDRVFELPDLIKDYPKADVNRDLYDDNENLITEDHYGEPLIEIPIDDLVYHLRYLKSRPSCCSNLRPVLEALETIIHYRTPTSYWSNVVCLHYGY